VLGELLLLFLLLYSSRMVHSIPIV